MTMPILKVTEMLEQHAKKAERACGSTFVEACHTAAKYLVQQGEQIVDLQNTISQFDSDMVYQQSRLRFLAELAAGDNKTPISVEGFKAFRGVMKIRPKTAAVPAFELVGDWLYRPDTGCWYGKGSSFGKDICTIMEVFG